MTPLPRQKPTLQNMACFNQQRQQRFKKGTKQSICVSQKVARRVLCAAGLPP